MTTPNRDYSVNPFVVLPRLTRLEAEIIRDLLGVALGMSPPPPADGEILHAAIWSLHTAFAEAVHNHDPLGD